MALSNYVAEPDPLEMELLGKLRRCCKCGEWWPEDRTFFWYLKAENDYDRTCIACRVEISLGRPCTAPGCPEPRIPHHTKCRQHWNEWQRADNRRKKHGPVSS